MTLVILAAGMGSRFGGLKQVTPMGPDGEFLIDYSIYDAIKCGFDHVVFIIKEENYDLFRSTIGKRIEDKIKVDYVFQDINNIPVDVKIPETRIKPWGTAQAIYCCKDIVNDKFAIINADDFYGYDAINKAAKYLDENNNNKEFGLIAYDIKNTLTENGSVKRGVCFVNANSELTEIRESKVEKVNNIIKCVPLDASENYEVNDNQLVSMNLLCFTPYIFDLLNNDIVTYFKNSQDLTVGEFLIPDVIFDNIKKNNIKVKVIETSAKWCGVTYKEDTDSVKNTLLEYKNDGVYPAKLWK